jgi:4-hydroxy-tetrahydrodipicolinate reductase
MIKVIMHGCNGKMGRVVRDIIKNDENTEIVAGIDIQHTTTYTFPVFTNIEDCDMPADVIIDFSTASAVPAVLEYAKQKSIPAVICTTGLSQEHIACIKEASKELPVFFSANMSIGVNLIINLAKKATEILSDANFDIEIIEKHHNQKIDAPSGTALAMADAINETLNNAYNYKYDRTKERAKREKNEIGIHAVRGGTIVGEHEIIFAGKDEVVELKHSATSKEIFAVGAVKAAKYLVTKTPGIYDMGNLMNEM